MPRKYNPTEESFLKDVAKHEMTVLMDNGLYRHLRFQQPNSWNMGFSIVTYPGYLVYSGDMGCFVFSRLQDMFEFFRTDREKDRLGINRSYWAEKLQAKDRNGFDEFSPDAMRETIEDHVAEWIEYFAGPFESDEEEEKEAKAEFAEAIREAVNDDVYAYLDEGEHEARRAVRDFSFEFNSANRFGAKNKKYEFQDSWEWSCREYTYRFTWCCYALAWAIKTYDASKTPAPQQEVADVA